MATLNKLGGVDNQLSYGYEKGKGLGKLSGLRFS